MQQLRAAVLLIFVLVYGLLGGCNKDGTKSYPSVETLTPGIFLEPEEREGLPPGVVMRAISDTGLQLTKVSEGFRGLLYNDAARYCTIAYGHLIKLAPCDGTEPKEFQGGISEPRGTQLLRKDMQRAQWAVMTSVEVDLTDGQYAALCDFVYNAGSGNFRRSTLRKVINARQYDRVPFQFRRWVKAGGRELPGLKTRREREIELFFEGISIPRAAPAVGEDLSLIDIQLGESSGED